ncbi:MAG: hypothetical protein FJ388_04135 [Verrucomicrobia bacterium]|nr:hypothetical protein [Verrucomicrobiota bacterium]
MSTVEEIEQAVEQLEVKDQLRLLRELPACLKVSLEEIGWLKLASSSFDFWDNPEDAIYDKL